MRNITRIAIALYLLLFLTRVSYPERTVSNPDYQFTRAHAILSDSIRSYGGMESLNSIANFQVRAVGNSVHRNQSRSSMPPYDSTAYSLESIVDISGNQISHTTAGGYPGGFTFQQTLIARETDSYLVDHEDRTYTKGTANFPAFVRYRLRWLPQLALISIMERPAHVRFVGRTRVDGRPHEILAFAEEDGTQIDLIIDSTTKLIRKISIVTGDLLSGDVASELSFPRYSTVSGHKVPARRIRTIGGEVIEDLQLTDIRFNQPMNDSKLSLPVGLNEAAVASQLSEKIADETFIIKAGSYNVLAIGFVDHVMVIEAPLGEMTSRRVIAEIKRLFPGKPIKYIAVTHHHDDHAGGFRTYIAEGAVLVTTTGNINYFNRIARRKGFLLIDSLSENPRRLKIESISMRGVRTFADGTRSVELHDIGLGPHAREMLIAYFPKEKILFQGDLINRSASGKLLVNETSRHFAAWIAEKRVEVEKIIPVHGQPILYRDFLKEHEVGRLE